MRDKTEGSFDRDRAAAAARKRWQKAPDEAVVEAVLESATGDPMSDDAQVQDDGRDIDPGEYRRMLNRALREGDRRLREGKLGDTSLSRYMSQAVTFLEEERRREEAARPDPAGNVAEADDFLSSLRQMHDDGRITTARLSEVMPSYLALCEEHLEAARAFAKELAA